ncbi:MAG: HypC/HybG/HupF family hydrogenase formation chaperone [Sulfobacillus thermotolerans]|uniref:Hydrogenase n=1 Tax=Sulfobacillus thermotolerans TaxID=338644 RepID=A0ABN5H3E5_9FIRM|nr:hydrogenase [Sulfobacillus thermotolerans]MCY0909040.1 HypC/HybG/HupF family hydrogenase formation chaperone [Sulfobacillus thermotolerans]
MCLAIPGQIVELESENSAKLDVTGVRRMVDVSLLSQQGIQVVPGDWVVIHVGFAMNKINDQEAQNMLHELKSLGSTSLDDELALWDVPSPNFEGRKES